MKRKRKEMAKCGYQSPGTFDFRVLSSRADGRRRLRRSWRVQIERHPLTRRIGAAELGVDLVLEPETRVDIRRIRVARRVRHVRRWPPVVAEYSAARSARRGRHRRRYRHVIPHVFVIVINVPSLSPKTSKIKTSVNIFVSICWNPS